MDESVNAYRNRRQNVDLVARELSNLLPDETGKAKISLEVLSEKFGVTKSFLGHLTNDLRRHPFLAGIKLERISDSAFNGYEISETNN